MIKPALIIHFQLMDPNLDNLETCNCIIAFFNQAINS